MKPFPFINELNELLYLSQIRKLSVSENSRLELYKEKYKDWRFGEFRNEYYKFNKVKVVEESPVTFTKEQKELLTKDYANMRNKQKSGYLCEKELYDYD